MIKYYHYYCKNLCVTTQAIFTLWRHCVPLPLSSSSSDFRKVFFRLRLPSSLTTTTIFNTFRDNIRFWKCEWFEQEAVSRREWRLQSNGATKAVDVFTRQAEVFDVRCLESLMNTQLVFVLVARRHQLVYLEVLRIQTIFINCGAWRPRHGGTTEVTGSSGWTGSSILGGSCSGVVSRNTCLSCRSFG